MKKAILFPGQGAQYPGMGKTFYESNETFRQMVDRAEDHVPYALRTIMFTSEAVHETRYAQPALYVMGCAFHDALLKEGIHFDMAAGLSIGEYAALYARGVYDFKTGLEIVEKRARYMQKSAQLHETAMVAVRTDMRTAQNLIEDVENIYISNHNSDNQVVLAGSKEAVGRVQSRGQDRGFRRMILLKTSGAFHTPYMEAARRNFESHLKTVDFKEPSKGLYLNVTGDRYQGQIKRLMVDQMTHTVLLSPMLKVMIEDGLDAAVEAGPGKTLSTFLRKTDKTVWTLPCSEEPSIESISEKLRSERNV